MPKKRKTKARARTQQPSLPADAADELLALQAIYGDELEVLPDGKSFSLVIVPHPGDGGVNRVSLRLIFSYPVGYPHEALEVKYKDLDGINQKQAKEVLKELKQVAAQQASQDSIAGFDVIQAAQQGLQVLNGSQAGVLNDDEPSGSVEEAARGAEHGPPVSMVGSKDVPAEVNDPVDLGYSDEASSFEAFDWAEGGLYLDDLFEAGWEEPELMDSPPPVASSAPAASPAIKRILPQGVSIPSAVPRLGEKTSSHAERTARFSEPPASLAESSRTGSMLAGIKSGISALGRALLPAQLRGLMDGEQMSVRGDDAGSDGASSSEESGETKELDRDLLIGHLLTRGTAATDLPDVLQMLQARRLIPRWVGWLLLNRPDLFEVALRRLADRSRRLLDDGVCDNMGSGTVSFSNRSKSKSSVDVDQFWRGTLINHDKAGNVPTGTTAAATSRYRSDFVELRPLGRGAFGLVVAATNRMDGRVYAIKRIALDAQTPMAYARIMREVTTLSRLQHPHVVRYFQAWTEEATAASSSGGASRGGHQRSGTSATETISTLGVERSLSASETAAWGHSETDARSTRRITLPAVPEASEEGASGEEAQPSRTFSHAREWWEEITSQSTTVVSQPDAAPQEQRWQQTLYIQMEYCTRTLRDVLDAGPLEDCDRWRVLRQILAGLAYIHDQGIIHRDLKPANIFYDAKGEIKLGDFGLAKLAGSDQASEPVEPPQHSAAITRCAGGAEHTTQVGTSFYISPEIMNGWASYDERVDSYSLGILTFELWHPFSTGMERAILLRDLREHGVMPAEFEAANPGVCRLIHWMLRKNPAERPTARQVLGSDLLPPTVGDEQLNDLLRSLPENPATQQRVVDALFALSDDHSSTNALDVAGAPLPIDMHAWSEVTNTLVSVFSLSGAVRQMSRELGADVQDQESPGAVHLLSARGERMMLRHELRAAFAGWALRHAALLQDGFARYELARVVRGGPKHGLSRQAALADLDIVAAPPRDRAEALLPLAEVAALVCSALAAIPSAGDYELRVGHVGLLQLALRHAGVPQELRAGALRLLSTATTTSPRDSAARSARWPAIRAGLEGLGLSPEAAARCRQLLVLGSGEPEAALHWLRATLGHLLVIGGASNRDERHYITSPLDDIEQLLIAFEDAGHLASSATVVEALMAPQGDQFSGLLLQWHVKAPASTQTKTTALVAAGGRYDRLLKAVWARQTRPGPLLGGAGVTINVDRLVQLTARGNSGEHVSSSLISVASSLPGLARLSAAEALVASRGGGGMIRERLALLRTLREAGIAAETLRAASPSLTTQYDYAASRGIPMLIILHGASFSADNHVHVKCRLCRSEESVPAEDVARYIRQHTRLAHGQRGWNDDVEDERELGWKERERRRRSRPMS